MLASRSPALRRHITRARLHHKETSSRAFSDERVATLARAVSARKPALVDAASVGETSQELSRLRSEIGQVSKALSDLDSRQKLFDETHHLFSSDPDPELRALAAAELPSLQDRLRSSLSALRSTLLAHHPSPSASLFQAPILVELTPGEGGPDSCLWIADLLEIYQRAWLKTGWRYRVVDEEWTYITGSNSGATGLKRCLVEVWDPRVGAQQGKNWEERDDAQERDVGVYERWRWETGVHRVQMISAADLAKRIMTSAGVVYVIPTGPLTQDEEGEVLDMRDVRIDLMKASGPGGQHVNKTESAVRLTHSPSGIVVSIQESRSQAENKKIAISILRSRLLARRREARQEAVSAQRREQIRGTSRSDRIRTYNFQQSRCTDHRIHLSLSLPSVQDGPGLETLHDALAEDEEERQLEALWKSEMDTG